MPNPLISTLVIASFAGVTTLVPAPGQALLAPASAALAGPELEVASGTPARTTLISTTQVPQRAIKAWQRFQVAAGGQWQATWDGSTGVPLRIYGSGIAAPGSVADPNVAEQHARALLADHIALLAPASTPADFKLVSNEVHHGIRSIGFLQSHAGMRIVGGQVSVRFKADRLVMIGSEALPNVHTKGTGQLDEATLRKSAQEWILADRAATAVPGKISGPMLLPIISTGGVRFHRVMSILVDGNAPIGKWRVYLDASNGSRVAREQTLRFGDATLSFDVPLRQPLSDRGALPVKGVTLTVNGDTQQSGEDGDISWTGVGNATVNVGVVGPLINVTTQTGSSASVMLSVPSDGSGVWDESGDELLDAQLAAFVHARIAKDAVRVLNPGLAWLNTQLPVNVNINDACNAFSDGNSINFFIESSQCANTARLADVVYHEFGHSMHANSIIEGVGAFDGAFSEGLSDYLAASITGDPAMGVGFFKNNAPLRHIDPDSKEHIWPRDVAEIHTTGIIFAGTMWDLRKLLITKYGQELGASMTNQYFYGAVQRASSIPATYAEVLLEDDDDGDLSNGTPNICDINAVFGAHGLRDLHADAGNLSVVAPGGDGYDVELKVGGLIADCPGDRVASASINWLLRADHTIAGDVEMSEGDGATAGVFTGTIPSATDGAVVRYSIHVDFLDGSSKVFPTNPADPRYEFYVGEIVELYCTDFETDPFDEGWTHELASGEASDGADDWQWGAPFGGASRDPNASYSGESIVGNDLGGADFDGKYQADKVNYLLSPSIDVGDYSDVRLQYRRWLNVEDGFFDQGSIYSNDKLVWTNFNSDSDNESTLHHTDQEWRFHDVALSGTTDGAQTVQIKYEISSDGGLEMGGWNIDDFCVVANANAICGDSELYGTEQCDDGGQNSDTQADACRSNCQAASCGDGVLDTGESCDDGNTVSGDGCESTCLFADEEGGDCGCAVGGEQPWAPKHSALALLGLLGLLIVRRRPSQGRK